MPEDEKVRKDVRVIGNPPQLPPDTWLYDFGDPATAVRNKLRQLGMYGNPFNPAWMRRVDSLASAAFAQYLAALAQGAAENNTEGFGQFLDRYLGGNVQWNSQLAGQGLDAIRAVQAKVGQAVIALNGGEIPVSLEETKDLMDRAVLAGHITPTEYAIAGFMMDPRQQVRVYASAYEPILGPTLSEGLLRGIAPVAQEWSDYLGPLAGSAGFTQLLDVLRGNGGATALSRPFKMGEGLTYGKPSPTGIPPATLAERNAVRDTASAALSGGAPPSTTLAERNALRGTASAVLPSLSSDEPNPFVYDAMAGFPNPLIDFGPSASMPTSPASQPSGGLWEAILRALGQMPGYIDFEGN